jgi:hypothetical protein
VLQPLQALRAMRRLTEDMEEQLRRWWRSPASIKVHEKIGEGGSGEVHSAKDTRTGQLLAVKLIKGVKLDNLELDTLLKATGREVAALHREVAAMAMTEGVAGVCRCGGVIPAPCSSWTSSPARGYCAIWRHALGADAAVRSIDWSMPPSLDVGPAGCTRHCSPAGSGGSPSTASRQPS